MSDFEATWSLIRGRFDECVSGLSQEQLNWRLHEGVLTIGEMALHVAGVEVSFVSQLRGETLDERLSRVSKAATDGVVNDHPFPFSPDEISPESVSAALTQAREMTQATISNPDKWRHCQIKSALGPMVDGTGAFARLAYHPGYHQGQVHMIRSAPGFPRS